MLLLQLVLSPRDAIHDLSVGEFTSQVSGEEVQSDVRLVGGHLVAGSVHGEEGQLGVGPLGQEAGSLLVDGVRLPLSACDGVAEAPDLKSTARTMESLE